MKGELFASLLDQIEKDQKYIEERVKERPYMENVSKLVADAWNMPHEIDIPAILVEIGKENKNES